MPVPQRPARPAAKPMLNRPVQASAKPAPAVSGSAPAADGWLGPKPGASPAQGGGSNVMNSVRPGAGSGVAATAAKPAARKPAARRPRTSSGGGDDGLNRILLRVGGVVVIALIAFVFNASREKSHLAELSAEFKQDAIKAAREYNIPEFTPAFVDANHEACLKEAYVAGDRRHLGSYDSDRYVQAMLRRVQAKQRASGVR